MVPPTQENKEKTKNVKSRPQYRMDDAQIEDQSSLHADSLGGGGHRSQPGVPQGLQHTLSEPVPYLRSLDPAAQSGIGKLSDILSY